MRWSRSCRRRIKLSLHVQTVSWFSLECHKGKLFLVKDIRVKLKDHTPCSLDSQNPTSGDRSSITTILAFRDSLAHVTGLGLGSASEVKCLRRNLYLPSSPTYTHQGAPPCSHRSAQCVRSIIDISTLRPQYLTWMCITCRPLRAYQDNVSADG